MKLPPFKIILLSLALVLAFSPAGANEKENYLSYHAAVSKAEEFASKREFAEAMAVYDQLFQEYGFIFLRDCKVATQLALYLGEEASAFRYLRIGITQGWEMKSIKKNNFLKPLRQEKEWEVIESEYDSLRESYRRRINSQLRKEVHRMFKKDQWLAIGALLRFGPKAQDRYAERKFAPNSRKQLSRLAKMLETNGYPGEKLIGNSYWMETILSHHNSISKAHTQKDTLYSSLRPQLLLALQRGEISPFELGIIDNWRLRVKGGWESTSYGFLSSSLTEEEVKKANGLREQLGLRSVETRNRLIAVQEETGLNFYLPGWPEANGRIKIVKQAVTDN